MKTIEQIFTELRAALLTERHRVGPERFDVGDVMPIVEEHVRRLVAGMPSRSQGQDVPSQGDAEWLAEQLRSFTNPERGWTFQQNPFLKFWDISLEGGGDRFLIIESIVKLRARGVLRQALAEQGWPYRPELPQGEQTK